MGHNCTISLREDLEGLEFIYYFLVVTLIIGAAEFVVGGLIFIYAGFLVAASFFDVDMSFRWRKDARRPGECFPVGDSGDEEEEEEEEDSEEEEQPKPDIEKSLLRKVPN